jgi:hypothetical protein
MLEKFELRFLIRSFICKRLLYDLIQIIILIFLIERFCVIE